MRKENCAERIRKGLSIKNMKASELCEKTGIPKSAMSQYINGKFEPKQDRLYLIAKALEVSEPWLMGFDVPMISSPAPAPEKEEFKIDVMIATESKDLSDKDKEEVLHLIQFKKYQTDGFLAAQGGSVRRPDAEKTPESVRELIQDITNDENK